MLATEFDDSKTSAPHGHLPLFGCNLGGTAIYNMAETIRSVKPMLEYIPPYDDTVKSHIFRDIDRYASSTSICL